MVTPNYLISQMVTPPTLQPSQHMFKILISMNKQCVDGEIKSSQGFGTCNKQSTPFFADMYYLLCSFLCPEATPLQACTQLACFVPP